MSTQPEPHHLDGTELIIALLRKNFPEFRAVFEGDPYEIGQSLLPCLIVSKQSGTSKPGATGIQDVSETILIQIVVNKKDDFGAVDANPNADLTNRRLRIKAEGRDQNTGMYLENSICGVLTKNITLGNTVSRMELATDYSLTLRTDEMITSEAHISVYIEERIAMPMLV
jgi:hypothetical protein